MADNSKILGPDIVTRLSIDDMGTVSTLKGLRTQVSALMDSWKAQNAMLESAQEHLEAAKTKYEGLMDAMQKQQEYINALKDRQSELDTSTTKGAEQFARLEKQIASASRQMANMSAQQQRAKDSMDYYSLGIDKTLESLHAVSNSSNNIVERLKAQGHNFEAVSEQVKGYDAQLDKLNELYHERQEQLARIDESQGKESSAYRKTAESLDNLKTQIVETEARRAEANHTLREYTSGIKSLQENLDRVTVNSSTMIERLELQGRTYEANYEKSKMYGEQLATMSQLYDKQAAELEKIKDEQGETSEAYRTAKENLDALGTKIIATEEDQKKLNQSFSNTHLSVAKMRDAYLKVGESTEKLRSDSGVLFDKIKAGAMAGTVAITGMGLGFVTAANKAAEVKSQYKVIYNNLITGGEKASTAIKNVNQMQKDGREYSIKYGKSQKDIADAYLELIKRGYSSSQALGAMKLELEGSIASGDDFKDVVSVASTTLESFGMRAKTTAAMTHNTSTAINILTYAADRTATNFQQLGIGMSYVGATAHSMGFSLAETAAAMGELSNRGLEADKAGMGLRKVLNGLVAAVKNINAKDSVLKKLGINKSELVTSNGQLRSLTTVMDVLHQHTENLTKTQKAAVFKALFGTTGEQAGVILANNSQQLGELVQKTEEAGKKGDYVQKLAEKNSQTAQMSEARFREAWNALTIQFGTVLLPYMTKAADQLSVLFSEKSFQRDVRKAAQELGQVAQGILNVGKFAVEHETEVKIFGEILLATFATKKILSFGKALGVVGADLGELINKVSGYSRKNSLLSRLFGTNDAQTVKTEVVNTATDIANDATKSAENSFNKIPTREMYRKITKAPEGAEVEAKETGMGLAGKLLTGVTFAVSAYDIGKAFFDKGRKKKYEDVGSGVGSAIGAGIGLYFGGPAGAMFGSSVGQLIGNTLGKALSKRKIDGPKIDMTKSFNGVFAQNKKFMQTEIKDLQTLYQKGDITKKEYQRRLKELETGEKRLTGYQKLSETDRTALAKYYASQRASVTSKYNKQRQNDERYWNQKILTDEKTFGANSVKVKNDEKQKKIAIEKDNNRETDALQHLAVQFTSKNEVAIAKLHETLTGRIKLEAGKQKKIYYDLVNSKKKLSNSEIQTMVNNSNKEYNAIVSNANKEYKDTVTDAEKEASTKIAKAKSAFEGVKNEQEAQYNAAVSLAWAEYNGTDKASTSQRNKVISNASAQASQAIAHASQQENSVVSNANKQADSTINAAKSQKSETIHNAKAEEDSVVKAARKKSRGVVQHATRQANSTMKASSHEAGGIGSIWKSIIHFFNGLTHWFGIKPINFGGISTYYAPISGMAYANGTTGAKAGMALVGEAGPELRYTPYSGRYSLVGMHGAELINLSAGEQILNANDTAALLNGNYHSTLPGYASGTMDISSFLNKLKHNAMDIFENFSEKAFDVLSKLTDPFKKIKEVADKAFHLSSIPDLGQMPLDIGNGMVKKVEHAIADFLKKITDKFTSFGGGAGVLFGGSNPGGSGVARWKPVIYMAASLMHTHLADWQVNKLLRQIATESGGNPTIRQQIWDQNMAAGDPAMGLLQFIPPTFAHWSLPGHNHILSGLDQIMAAINALNHGGEGGWGNIGNGHGWSNGGFVDQWQIAEIAEGNKPEMVIPLDIAKRGRGLQLLEQTKDYFNNNNDSLASERSDIELNHKLDMLIALLSSLVQNSKQPTSITIDNSIDGKKLANAMVKHMTQAQKVYNNQNNFLKGIRPSMA